MSEDSRDDFDAQREPPLTADEFLLDFFPKGTPQEVHDAAVVMLDALRVDAARRLSQLDDWYARPLVRRPEQG
jgi:hypothetical protein